MLSKFWFLPKQQFLLAVDPIKDYQRVSFVHQGLGIQINEYLVSIPFYKYIKAEEQYQYRFDSSLSIFKPYHASIITQKRELTDISIFIQKEKILLERITILETSSAISIIINLLPTIKNLTLQYGYFLITPKMIGMTSSMLWKIWINQKFEENQRQYVCNSQQIMIKCLFDLIAVYTQRNYQSNQLFSHIKINKLNFAQAQKFLEDFTKKYQTMVPSIIMNCSNNDSILSANLSSFKINRSKASNLIQKIDHSMMYISKEEKVQLNSSPSQYIKPMKNLEDSSNYQNYFQRNQEQQRQINSNKTIKSTKVSHDFTYQTQIRINLGPSKSKLKKYRTLKMQVTRAYDVSYTHINTSENQDSKILRNNNRKNRNTLSDCNSSTDFLEKQIVQKCIQKNNWITTIDTILSIQTDLNKSIYLQDDKQTTLKKIEELNKLKLNKFSRSREVYSSILENDTNNQIEK